MSYSQSFVNACQYGSLNTVKELLTGKHKRYVNIHYKDNAGFNWACENGSLDIVKYLLTSPDLEEHINIKDGQGLCDAAMYGQNAVVHYLLTSPDLLVPDASGKIVGHANIHVNNDEPFRNACDHTHISTIEYFLFEQNLNITPYLATYINKDSEFMATVRKMLECRDLYNSLQQLEKKPITKMNKL